AVAGGMQIKLNPALTVGNVVVAGGHHVTRVLIHDGDRTDAGTVRIHLGALDHHVFIGTETEVVGGVVLVGTDGGAVCHSTMVGISTVLPQVGTPEERVGIHEG